MSLVAFVSALLVGAATERFVLEASRHYFRRRGFPRYGCLFAIGAVAAIPIGLLVLTATGTSSVRSGTTAATLSTVLVIWVIAAAAGFGRR